jgi:hypothetical protein
MERILQEPIELLSNSQRIRLLQVTKWQIMGQEYPVLVIQDNQDTERYKIQGSCGQGGWTG